MTAPSVVNSYIGVTASSSLAVSIAATGSGNLLVVFLAASATTFGIKAPSATGTTFSNDVPAFGSGSTISGGLYSGAPPTGTTSVTINTGGLATTYIILEINSGSNPWASSPFDVAAHNLNTTGTSPATTGTSGTTAQAVELVLAFEGHPSGLSTDTVGGSYTGLFSGNQRGGAGSLVTSATGSQSASFSLSLSTHPWAAIVAAYMPQGIVTSTRQIPDQAALSLTSQRLVPNKAALGYSPVRSIPNGVALQGSFRRTVPNKAALIETSMRSVPNQAALAHTVVRSVPNRAELTGSIVRSIPNRVALINTASRSIPNQAELADEHIRRIPNRVFLYTPIPPDGRIMTRPEESPSRRNEWRG